MAKKKWYKKTAIYNYLAKVAFRKKLKKWTDSDQEMADFYAQFISPGDVCFDVGANLGNRTKVFLHLGARVIAVEPQEGCAQMLQAAFADHPNFVLVPKALGAEEGEATMLISQEHTLSSLSADWVNSVQASGRFSQYSWDEERVVKVTTIDNLITRFTSPAFIKIDVEGFEEQVVSGLSAAVKVLSLEFIPEYIESMVKAIEHLGSLGDIRLNYAVGESMDMVLEEWKTREEMITLLRSLAMDTSLFGDVYIRYVD